jgi:hypothetical protein
MLLEYTFNINREVPFGNVSYGDCEPDYVVRNVETDYIYDCDIEFEDFLAYERGYNYKEMSVDYKYGFETALKRVFDEFTDEIIDRLEDDKYFIEFMTERKEHEAYLKCKDYYEDYN